MKIASPDDFENQLCQWMKSKNDKDIHEFLHELKSKVNDATQLKNFLFLKLPPIFRNRLGDGKRQQFQTQKFFN